MLEDGRCLTPRKLVKVLGVTMDSKGSAMAAIMAREQAATCVCGCVSETVGCCAVAVPRFP